METGHLLDFTDVGSALKRAGGRITRFATVIHNDYTGSTGSLFYRLTIEAGNQASLVVDAHTLAPNLFGVRASLMMGRDGALCAAWSFNGTHRSILDVGAHALCVKCTLKTCDGITDCAHADVQTSLISIDRLTQAVVDWTRNELPADALRNRPPH